MRSPKALAEGISANVDTAEIILFESAKKYLKEHLGESKTLVISK
ncbi:conserved hypothetical protein [Streptococcus equi subsp. zooepidemicus ATCC 35246]|nr:conserved hypothetical protein [Streptococcus equi subsp. zooepidemicus ATCC 35246]AIA68682.1 hypothetical protein Q426_03590 [Streptococcus equi subsp. zooepidemicus CY]